MEQTQMKEKPVLGLLLSMALPMVISMMVNSLYNIVDSFFVAKISESAMTALSLVYPLQNLVNALMIGFGVGINAVIAFYLGARDFKKADDAASQGLFYNVVQGLLMTVVCIAVMPSFLRLFTGDEEVISLGVRYSNIVFLFAVAVAVELAFEKTYQAVGKMAVSMLCMIVGCVVNIILDPVLIFGLGPFPKLGIEGAALATGIGQTVNAGLYVIFYLIKPISVHIRIRQMRPTRDMGIRLYAIGIPATLNLALPSLLVSALNIILAGYGQIYVFVLGVYYKLQTFLYLPANGIIQGMRPLMGYNYGAGEKKRVRQIYVTALVLSAGIMVAGTILCQLIPGSLIQMFTTRTETVEAGAMALRIISLGFLVSALSVVSSGALEALGKGIPSLMISLCRYVMIIIPVAWILSHFFGAVGVWHAFWVTEVISGIISILIYQGVHKKEER
ncbi:MATE family efflux transporter [Brotaphodocola catenula]|uniref:Probable multidrug resistance protein NorM n=1 Tax=Brotaphodocola catenula TaxID=2885361 RepID=A0AAE3ARV8_9FIRM|nr:MATE family efflux transporter [Brotaphodocola catenula]MCC2165550.1 MATE family efflux transporter [Brotaphodocola catenula]